MEALQRQTKARTLNALKATLTSATILDQIAFRCEEWLRQPDAILTRVAAKGWLDIPLIARSSAQAEDTLQGSMAGHYTSLLDIQGRKALANAITEIASKLLNTDELFIQPMLCDVKLSGVIFTRDPTNGAPYFKLNYDDTTGRTDTVTAGKSNDTKVFYCHRLHTAPFGDFRDALIRLSYELETLLDCTSLDIEFAIDSQDHLYLFQVRPLVLPENLPIIAEHQHFDALQNLHDRVNNWMQKHPYLYGNRGLYGIMPDWNPAEIVGVKPKPLALSIYREVITNSIWAYQRDNYGYCRLRSFPLLVELEGMPYIDVRVSFNSFIPKSLDAALAEKLVNHYLDRLRANPTLHDKVEFDIVFSCYCFDTKDRLRELIHHGFTTNEIDQIRHTLLDVTNQIMDTETGLWQDDLQKVEKLTEKYQALMHSSLDDIAKIYWLIEDCKRYGTLPFAGLARAGFIAVELLKSLKTVGILTDAEVSDFLRSLQTVSGSIVDDFEQNLDKEQFISKYGHLRPGTYDILAKSYDEHIDGYYCWETAPKDAKPKHAFRLSVAQLNAIDAHLKQEGYGIQALDLLNFIKGAIEAREYAKFVFTRSISQVLKIYTELCQRLDIDVEDAAFTHLSSILSLNSVASDPKTIIEASIARRKARFELTKSIHLPPLITDATDIFCFYEPVASPNFITQASVNGEVLVISEPTQQPLTDKIILIESADPGFDWIFSQNIKGLVTKYGGANSHMAIRSAELGIPAIIGAGRLYDTIANEYVVTIDCLNKTVKCF